MLQVNHTGLYCCGVWPDRTAYTLLLVEALSVSQPYYVVGSNGQVSMHCIFKTKIQPQEMQVSLYKGLYGKERICSTSVNISYSQLETNERVHCRANVSNGRVDLTIFGLKGEDTDIYRCRVDIIFPPPYLRQFGNGTLVFPILPSISLSKNTLKYRDIILEPYRPPLDDKLIKKCPRSVYSCPYRPYTFLKFC
ncbi:T-cell-specific surface glycoprotein CD28-like [Astyanax mexicanus]|uniref:T-cell-specific surface glycoprotein CD28-like n=1 Tax=Astyanax mexicanus TaxID=7994 RepID=A0A8T2LNR9_ASTMX|nr:T-cell-specific surface glycoprotein CD28-like [Astyanax mexicanus]